MAQIVLNEGPYIFNGAISDAVVEPDQPTYQLNQGTWVVEFNADSVAGRRFLISKDSSGFDNGGHFGLYVENGDLVVRLQSLTNTFEVRAAGVIAAGTDYEVAFSFGPAGMKLYVDGVLVASGAYTGGLTGNQEPIVYGANQWASGDLVANKLRDPFDGSISSINLYNEALSAGEIFALANGQPPVAVDDAFSTLFEAPLTIDVAAELLANDSDPENDPISLVSFTQPSNGSVVDNGDGTLTYTPDAAFSGADAFTYTISDGNGGQATATATVNVAPAPATILSDDFSSAGLAPFWALEGPTEGAAAIGVSGGDAYLELSLPAGDFDVFNGEYNAARLLQGAPDEDFQVEAKFLTEPTIRFQIQGILIEQDEQNWIRYDLRFDGSTLKLFAGATTAGSTATQFNINVAPGDAQYLRATRVGDDWTMEYSSDGATWTTAGTFTFALSVSAVGPFAASTGGAPGYTAQVDYFFNTASPISPEDGALPTAPDAVDDALNVNQDASLIINVANDLLANDVDLESDPLSLVSFTQPINGTLVDNGNGTLTYTPAGGFFGQDTFTYTITDGGLVSDPATVTITVDEFTPSAVPDPLLDEGAHAFNGSTASAVILPHDAQYLLNNGTFAFEFNANDVSGRKFLLSKDSSGFDNGGHVGIYIENGALKARFQSTSATFELVAPNAVVAGVDYHLAVTFGAGGLKILLDGVEIASNGYTGGLLINEEPIVIGANQWASGDLVADKLRDAFNGTISSVQIYGEALDATQIDLLINGFPPVAGDDVATTEEGVAVLIDIAGLLANDSDPEGDAVSFVSFAQPANGTLVDNGDGTLTYTPNEGFVGDDTFTYTITDGNGFDSATVTVTVDPGPPPPAVSSDDFSDASGVLLPIWSVEGPAAGTGVVEVANGDAYLEITLPAGNFDLFNATYNAKRVLQDSPDDDFGVEAKFLTEPTAGTQIQGILIEQDALNWIRFDLRNTGSELRVFAATTENGSSTVEFDFAVASGDAQYLRATRTGDSWTMEYSADGLAWSTAGTFVHQLVVTGVGPFAAAVGGAGGYTAQVDYFFNIASPIDPEDAVLPNFPPDAVDDAFITGADADLVIDVAADLLANDTDPEGAALTLDSFTQPSNGTVTDNGDGTLTYSPATGFSGNDTFIYTVSDGAGNFDTATVTVSVDAPPVVLVSDDFSDASGALLPIWALEGPPEAGVGVNVAAGDAFMEISLPAGTFDIFNNTYDAARVLQDVTDGDFSAEAKFLSEPAVRFQIQGLLFEQDSQNWIRFDVRFDGTTQKVLAATTINGSTSIKFDLPIATGDAQYLRAARDGDLWTLEYSADGAAWTTAGTFVQALNVTGIGPFAASLGNSPGFTAQVDYFFNSDSPISPEDAVLPNIAPDAVNDAFAIDADANLLINVANDLLANDSDPEGAVVTFDSFTQPEFGSLSDNGDGTLTYTPPAGFSGTDTFTYTISDGAGGFDTAIASITVDAPAPPSDVTSDDFSGGVLLPIWSFEGGVGGTAEVEIVGQEAFLEIALPKGNFDIFNGVYNAGRVLQDVADSDLSVEAKFLSTPISRFQIQGVLIEQDAQNWIRFDLRFDGTDYRVFAATTINSSSTIQFDTVVAAGAAQYLRATRTGDSWTMEYSANGTNWTTAGSFTQALTVTSVGPFAAATSSADPFTAQVDYFFNTASPIVPEDDIAPISPPTAVDDAIVLDEDTSITFQPGDNDTDPENDPITTASITVAPTNGVAKVNANGTVTYTPNPNFNGSDSFAVRVTDGNAGFDTSLVTVTVNPVADAPVAVNDAYQIGEGGGSLTVNASAGVLANDLDPDGDPLTASLVDAPADGTVTLNPDGSFTYTPGPGFTGTDSFTYQVNDGTGGVATAFVSLADVNSPPQLVTGQSAFTEVVIDNTMAAAHAAFAGDIDGDGDIDIVATAELIDEVSWYENDGSLGFTKHVITTTLDQAYPVSMSDFDLDGDIDILVGGYGVDQFIIYENDGDGNFTIGATLTGDGPHSIYTVDMDDDGDLDLITSYQQANSIIWYENVSGSYVERLIDNDLKQAKTAVAADVDGDGDMDVIATGNTADDVTWYENDGAENFSKRFIDREFDGAYFAVGADIDGDGDLDVIAVAQKANALAVYENDGSENFSKRIIDGNVEGARTVQADDVDGDGDIDLVATARVGNILTWYENDGDGNFTRRVVDGDIDGIYGVHIFDVNRDGLNDIVSAARDSGEIAIHVQSKAHSAFIGVGSTFVIDATQLNAVDVDNPPSELIYTITDATDAGEVRLNGVALGAGDSFTQEDVNQGLVTYTHLTLGTLNDGFAFSLSDGGAGGVAPTLGSFDFTVTSTPPNAVNDTAVTNEDQPVTINVLANDTDPEGRSLRILSVADPAKGSAVIDDNGTPTNFTDDRIVYTPDLNVFGTDTFVYTLQNSEGGIDTAQVQVTVNRVDDDPPVAIPDSFLTPTDTPLTLVVATALLGNDSDPDGDALTLDSFTQPANGSVVDNGDGTLTYTPDLGVTGNDTFTYTVSDGRGGFDTATVSILVGNLPGGILSDDFNDQSVNGFWTLEGSALGDAEINVVGGDAVLELIVPEGNFDAFNGTYTVPRLMQAAIDEDFAVEARFISVPTERFQIQGLLFEQDPDNWIRFDLRSDGTNLRLLAATTTNDSSNIRFDFNVTVGEAEYLRATRTGDDWTMEYSSDGVDWNVAGEFTQALNVAKVGPFAGATQGATGFTAQVDYFFNTAAPITPEDPVLPDIAALPDPVFAIDGQTNFDGSNGAVINLEHDPALAIAEGTIAFEFIANNAATRQGLFTKDASGFINGGHHVAIYIENGQLIARFQDGVNSEELIETGIVAGQSYEVAATFGAGGVALFVDGALAASSTTVMTQLTTNVEYLQVGGLGWGSSATNPSKFTNPFSGVIADVEVYDEILDQNDILVLA